jgi:predicted enzyme related to lactoylglutathione lyase
MHYSQALLRGRRVVGMGPRMDDNQPVAWMTYLAVDDADKVVESIPAAGGTVLVPPTEIPESGRMAIALDPTGVGFGLWEAAQHRGSQLVNEPGTVVWNELVSPDLPAAQAFYAATLGVDWTSEDVGGSPYGLLQVGGRTAGGAIPGDAPHWELYFEVADADAAAARARELGGEVVSPVTATPQGPMATLRDPQGATFSIIASGSDV